MIDLNTYPMKESTIARLYTVKEAIELDPDYQRQGQLWDWENKRLFIDSIMTHYDVPKLYLHYLQEPRKKNGIVYQYAVIDGRQRLETLWEFIENKFKLEKLNVEMGRKCIELTNVYYRDLAANYPTLKSYFDNYVLPIILVETKDDDEDLVEDMFTRLNDAVSINAAEKRNAIGGHMVELIRSLSHHQFFQEHIGFDNRRYKHYEVLARLLFLEHSIEKGEILDTKKAFLDVFVKDYKKKRPKPSLETSVFESLDAMCQIFGKKDPLLRKQARVPIYYLLVREARRQKKLSNISRQKIIAFNDQVADSKRLAVSNIEQAKPDLLEYDRLTIQGTNDASSIKTRFRIISKYFGISSSFIYDM